MGFWKKLFGRRVERDRLDYYQEGLDLMGEDKYHEALTSLRLALKQTPGDVAVLQQIAIAYTRIGMTEEAAKTYRHVLQRDPAAAGAHYGLAFLLLHAGESGEASTHLKAFLEHAPGDPSASRHVEHARQTLTEIAGGAGADPTPDERG